MNNDSRFDRLMQKIGGMRRRQSFEYSFGAKPEETMRITPADRNVRRIMGELEFALKLDRYDENGGMYSKLISNSIGVLEEALGREGGLTAADCARAEQELLPMSGDAKEYRLILCGHAHIDMNWMWSFNETVAATCATFTTMCNLLDEYPDFCFSQSQASTYKIVERYDPDLMERMKKHIRDGRWEVTAGAWVETDKNMPSGESLIKTIELTKKYLEEIWEVPGESLQIDFSPDTFGHSANVPEIDRYGGLKYYYHCRGIDDDYVLYRFRSPSGAEVLAYREPYWYNSGITPLIGAGLPALCGRMGGLKTGLIVYGVGDHGGGVTRRDIENAIEMKSWPVFPEITFGTFREFFGIADVPEIRDRLPVVDREINFLFDGCYTTQSRIKRANRLSEAKMNEAQTMSAIAKSAVPSFRYNHRGFEEAWQKVLFTHFHDIITGSNVQDSREYAMGLYQEALAAAETEEGRAFRVIADNVDTSCFGSCSDDMPYGPMSEGAGAGFIGGGWRGIPNPERGAGKIRPYVVFNPSPVPFSGNVTVTVWDWPGDVSRAFFTDHDGNEPPFALAAGSQRYWDHNYVVFLVKLTIPAFGYASVALGEREVEEYPSHAYSTDWGKLSFENEYVLENGRIRAEFDMNTMSLKSLRDKASGREMLDTASHSGLVLIDTQDNPMSAWIIGKHLNVTPVTSLKRVDRFDNPLRHGYSFVLAVLGSRINAEIYLDEGSEELRIRYSVDWNERSGETLPLLAFRVALKDRAEKYICDVPAGVTERGCANHDVPALSFVSPVSSAPGEERGCRRLVLRSDCKYGYRLAGDNLTLSLINTSHNPDPLPERTVHDISLSLGISDPGAVPLLEGTELMMHPPVAVPTGASDGKLPPCGTLLEVSAPGAQVSAVECTGKGDVKVRFYELTGNNTRASVKSFGRAAEVELDPYSIADAELKGQD